MVQGQILFDMQELMREAGTALIWITRDPSVIAGLVDRIGVLYAGRMVELGYAEDVLRAPRHPYTGALLDSVPGHAPPGEKIRQMAGVGPSLIDLPPGCTFRPALPLRDRRMRADSGAAGIRGDGPKRALFSSAVAVGMRR